MDFDVAVVGAGVIGLATAAALARGGRSVVVLERDGGVGRGITARNSEVIHAGIYYPAGSLKARLCVEGRELLYARCAAHAIPHRRLGKLIVASQPEEIESLERLYERGVGNGVTGLEVVDARRVALLEPEVRAEAALVSPNSGIIDGQALCLSYLAELESLGGVVVLHTEVIEIELVGAVYRLATRGADGERSEVECAGVVNAAGLSADSLAERAGFDLDACGYRVHPCKGDYFAVAPAARRQLGRLVYPVPSGAGLGVHVTLDLAGRIRLGPDAEYVAEPRYDVDPGKAAAFARAVSRYWPGIEAEWLTPDYAGVRPKLAASGTAFADFAIREESDRGRPGFVNLIGIESPGLTAAPAIAEHVVALLAGL